MKKILTSILVIFTTTLTAWSQQCTPEVFAKIHKAKIAFISDSLRLTPAQADKFFPVYNEYETEIRNTRHDFFKKYKGFNTQNASDGTSLQYIDDNLDYQQAVIEIKRKYNSQFLKIISPQQLTELYKAEREFKQLLLKHYLKQHNNGSGSRNMHGNGF